MATTSIEWTDRVWNPTTGCTKVSPGCKNCYAETIADRFWATQYQPVEYLQRRDGDGYPKEFTATRPRQFTDVQVHEDRLLEPLYWRKAQRVFVNSMSDLFHENVPFEFIDQVLGIIGGVERHTFQVLTKRAERMREYMNDWVRRTQSLPPRNLWLGVSVEDQAHADERIPQLLQTPAAVRFISYEPALGPLNLRTIGSVPDPPYGFRSTNVLAKGSGLHWIIVGGESGPGARPFDLQWARDVVIDCSRSDVKVFVKQLGARPHVGPDCIRLIFEDRKGGTPEEWPADLRVREFPT